MPDTRMAAWWMKGPVGREMRLSASHFVRMGVPPWSLQAPLSLHIHTYMHILVICVWDVYAADAVTLKTLYISHQTNRESLHFAADSTYTHLQKQS